MSPVRILVAAMIVFPIAASGCDYPDEGGMPLRRAVTKVQLLSEVDAWAEAMRRNRVAVQYVVRVDEPVREAGRCYWPVEVRADGKLWRSFLVTPDGKRVFPQKQD